MGLIIEATLHQSSLNNLSLLFLHTSSPPVNPFGSFVIVTLKATRALQQKSKESLAKELKDPQEKRRIHTSPGLNKAVSGLVSDTGEKPRLELDSELGSEFKHFSNRTGL